MSETRSIDLHNFTVAEALREFVRFYNNCVRSGYRGRLEVIHGYGSTGGGGVIREELRKYLKAHSESSLPERACATLESRSSTQVNPRQRCRQAQERASPPSRA
jgi:DNA-nicking Smr family endonuclease